jgi:hypothetical protein
MFKIDQETIQNLNNVNVLLNKLEIKGANNIDILYNALLLMQQSFEKIKELNISLESETKGDSK